MAALFGPHPLEHPLPGIRFQLPFTLSFLFPLALWLSNVHSLSTHISRAEQLGIRVTNRPFPICAILVSVQQLKN